MNIEIQRCLLPELQKIVWKKVFRECMIDLKEKTQRLFLYIPYPYDGVVEPKIEKMNDGIWMYRFTWNDGSGRLWDTDWTTSERDTKQRAKTIYQIRTGRAAFMKTSKPPLKRAKWIRIKASQ